MRHCGICLEPTESKTFCRECIKKLVEGRTIVQTKLQSKRRADK